MPPSDKFFGLLQLSIVICLWVASSTAIQILFASGFDKPFFLTYISTSLFSLYLLSLPFKNISIAEFKKTEKLALQFSPLWFGANYLLNLSLSMTSLSSNTTISSCSGVITLLLAVLILKDSPDALKFVASFLALGGVGLIAFNDEENSGEESVFGDVLAFFGAFVYSSYSIFLKAKTEALDLVVFFGCVGVTNTLMFAPGFLILDFTGVESFSFPSVFAWSVLLGNGLLGSLVSDTLWALSMRNLNPALCTVGLSLTIPISFLVESLIFSFKLTIFNACGAILIVFGFSIMISFEHSELRKYVGNKALKALLFSTEPSEYKVEVVMISK